MGGGEIRCQKTQSTSVVPDTLIVPRSPFQQRGAGGPCRGPGRPSVRHQGSDSTRLPPAAATSPPHHRGGRLGTAYKFLSLFIMIM